MKGRLNDVNRVNWDDGMCNMTMLTSELLTPTFWCEVSTSPLLPRRGDLPITIRRFVTRSGVESDEEGEAKPETPEPKPE